MQGDVGAVPDLYFRPAALADLDRVAELEVKSTEDNRFSIAMLPRHQYISICCIVCRRLPTLKTRQRHAANSNTE